MTPKIKKMFVCTVALFLIASLVQAKKIASFPYLTKPDQMAVHQGRLYITERATIHIYSLKDFKLIKKFGKQGEGPGEFKIPLIGPPIVVMPYTDHLLINSDNKLSYFTRDGEFIKERRTRPFSIYTPIGKDFVANGIYTGKDQTSFLTVNIYDDQFNNLKEIHRSNIPVGQNFGFHIPQETFGFQVYENKIYVPKAWDFSFDIYDSSGKKLHTINKDFKKRKVTAEYKSERLNWYKNESPFKQFWEALKDRVTFNEYFPPIQDFFVDSGKIFVFTYEKKGEKSECIVLDLKGNEQKRVFLSLPEATTFGFLIYAIEKNRFYTFVENLEEEEWQLIMEEI